MVQPGQSPASLDRCAVLADGKRVTGDRRLLQRTSRFFKPIQVVDRAHLRPGALPRRPVRYGAYGGQVDYARRSTKYIRKAFSIAATGVIFVIHRVPRVPWVLQPTGIGSGASKNLPGAFVSSTRQVGTWHLWAVAPCPLHSRPCDLLPSSQEDLLRVVRMNQNAPCQRHLHTIDRHPEATLRRVHIIILSFVP